MTRVSKTQNQTRSIFAPPAGNAVILVVYASSMGMLVLTIVFVQQFESAAFIENVFLAPSLRRSLLVVGP